MNGLSVMGVAYVALFLSCLVGYFFPSRRTAALVKLAFALVLAVLVLVVIWHGALMMFYYFNGGVAL